LKKNFLEILEIVLDELINALNEWRHNILLKLYEYEEEE